MLELSNHDIPYLPQIQSQEFEPIFILGLHRSGTTILYKMLTATNQFNPVTAYDLICYHSLLYNHNSNQTYTAKQQLTKRFIQQGQKDRSIDRLQINADFPEEYGFHLGRYTLAMHLTAKNFPYFKRLIRKIQHIKNPMNKILLKNPYDFANFLFITEHLPNAKIIFIHRNPYKTLSSLIKATQLIIKKRNYYTTQLFPLYNIIYNNPLLLYPVRLAYTTLSPLGPLSLMYKTIRSIQKYLRHLPRLSPKSYLSITYENLCNQPNDTIDTICTFLNIPLPNIDFTTYINRRKTTLEKTVVTYQNFIYKSIQAYFKKQGYPPELP